MAKSYTISNNIIFSVNDDGSITKFATISESGEFCRIGEKPRQQNKQKVWGYWVAMIALLIGCVVLFEMYNDAHSDYEYQSSQRRSAESKLSTAEQKISSLESEKSTLESEKRSAEEALSTLKQKVGDSYPLIISDIEIANVTYNGDIETNYGNTLYSSRTMYLKPRIKYYGISSGNKTLKVKWYNPNGTLKTGSSSPYGFSQSENCYIYNGSDNTYSLSGWGNSTRGHWSAGTYRIEVWYGNTCLKSKTFTIY